MEESTLALIIFLSVWVILSVFGNFLVVAAVIRDKKLRTVTNYFICNLAVGDILLAAIIQPQRIHDLSHTNIDYYEGDFLCDCVNALPVFCITSSVYSMIVIGYERYHTIVRNIEKQSSPITTKHSIIAISCVWGVSVLLSIPTVFEYGVVDMPVEGTNETYVSCSGYGSPQIFRVINSFVILFIGYLIPLALISWFYGKIVCFIWKRGSSVGPQNGQQAALSSSVVSRNRVRIVKMLILVAMLFALSWLPYFIILVIEKITGTDDAGEATGASNVMRICLSTFSTSYNILVYGYYNQRFRAAFRNMLCCRLKDAQSDSIDDRTHMSVAPGAQRF